MDLDTARVQALSDLWKNVLSVIPPTNITELLKEHDLIKQVLQVDDEKPVYDFHQSFVKSGRKEAVAKLKEWLTNIGVEHGAVEVRPSQHGFGLFATEDLSAGSIPVQVPHKAILSLDYGEEKEDIKRMHTNDAFLSSMSNVTLTMVLAHCVLTNDKTFSAYINALPESYQTTLFFTKAQLLKLKPSPVLEASLLMFRAVARHYIYFVLRIVSDTIKKPKGVTEYNFRKSPFNSPKFSFDLYRWCVSTTATRMNNVPSLAYVDSQDDPVIIPALIPLLDFANYKSVEENSAFMLFDGSTQSLQLHIKSDVKAGQEIFLQYGKRSNADFLLHNGFVPLANNPHNSYELRIGFPRTIPHADQKQKLLFKHGIQPERRAYSFVLDRDSSAQHEPTESALWHFAQVFVAADIEDVGKDKRKAQKFVVQRLQLLQKAYEGGKAPDEGAAPLDKFVHMLHVGELEVLHEHEQRFAQIQVD